MSETSASPFDNVRAVTWNDGRLQLLDQRRLPDRAVYLEYQDPIDVADAIRDMVVRGAPAIGITAAYAVVLAAKQAYLEGADKWRILIEAAMEKLAAARPTAVNLHWALKRMQALFPGIEGDPEPVLLAAARAIHDEDIAANQAMGKAGAALLGESKAVLTHCNTGSLATGGFGTALGVIRAARQAGYLEMVYVDETRPWLQGSRLTAWELMQDKIPVTLLTDSAAGYLMSQGSIQWVIVGADRVAANGDVANKIGTYGLAVAARHHAVKMMVVAPCSSFDLDTPSGDLIPVEDRGPDEILQFNGRQIAPGGVPAWNPVFDITPAALIDVIVTEKGVIETPDRQKIAAVLA